MKCQRCGFEIEEGQVFCSMCGTEQSRAQRPKKKSFKSILWIIKVTSKAHLKMWLVFLTTIVMAICLVNFLDPTSPLVLSSLCLLALLLGYELFHVLLGYKNPNATKTKAYKVKYRMCAILMFLLLIVTIFLDFDQLATTLHEFIIRNR